MTSNVLAFIKHTYTISCIFHTQSLQEPNNFNDVFGFLSANKTAVPEQ